MFKAYFFDESAMRPETVFFAENETLEEAISSALEHSKRHKNFKRVLCQERDEAGGWDMAVAIGNSIRIYGVNPQ